MIQFIRKMSIVPKTSCAETKPKKDCSAKELIEEFIKLMQAVGYTYSEIDDALGNRKKIKELNVEIGKLKSYIDELEYELNKNSKYN